MKKIVLIRKSKSGDNIVFIGAEVNEALGYMQYTGQVAWVKPLEGKSPEDVINNIIKSKQKAILTGEELDCEVSFGTSGAELVEG